MRNISDAIQNTDYKVFRAFLILNGLAMCIAYPNAMIFVEREGWIWDVPCRNLAMEHMLVAVYVTMGLFLINSARKPIQAAPFINFVIVSGFIHATVMLIDALNIPGEHEHLMAGADVVGTYLAPVTLTLSHPSLYSVIRKNSNASSEKFT